MDFYNQAKEMGEDKVIESCWNVIDEDAEKFVESEAFKQVKHEFLREVLSRDSLNIEEEKLFQAVVVWAKTKDAENSDEPNAKRARLDQENLRQAIGTALFLVRFPLMGLKKFSDCGGNF